MKHGYYWAKTPDEALFIVLDIDGRGFVPGVEGGIDLAAFTIIGPVEWPPQVTAANQASDLPKCGAPAAVAVPGCAILPFVANG